MAKSFRVSILTPEKKIFEGETTSLVVPAALGYLGVLADHAPLIAGLKPGKIILKTLGAGQAVIVNNAAGFIEVLKNRVTILLDSAAG